MAAFTLITCILTTCLLLIGLRFVQRYNLDLPLLVGINYFSAAAVGLLTYPSAFARVFAHSHLAILAMVQGLAFFGLFSIMGWMTRHIGVGYMTIVAKMSLVIPVLFSWLHYGDAMTTLQFIGIGLALSAIVLVNLGEKPTQDKPEQESLEWSSREQSTQKTHSKASIKTPSANPTLWTVIILSAILFIGTGASDALFKVLQQEHFHLVDSREYIIVLFAFAAIGSLPIFLVRIFQGKLRRPATLVLSGLALGIPNYFSIVFLAASLQYFDGTVFYPINNTAILLVMAIVGILAFRERLNAWKITGLALATAAVIMLA